MDRYILTFCPLSFHNTIQTIRHIYNINMIQQIHIKGSAEELDGY